MIESCDLQTMNPSVSEAPALGQDKMLGGARTARPAFSGRTFRELQEGNSIPSFEYAIQGMMCLGEVSMVVAEPKLGKTWLGVQVAVCAAKGLKFLGRKVRKKPAVLSYAPLFVRCDYQIHVTSPNDSPAWLPARSRACGRDMSKTYRHCTSCIYWIRLCDLQVSPI